MEKIKLQLDKQREVVYSNRTIFRLEEELIKRGLGNSVADYLTPYGEQDPEIAEMKAGLKLIGMMPMALFIWAGQEELSLEEVVDIIPREVDKKQEIISKIIPAIMSACGFDVVEGGDKKKLAGKKAQK